MGEVWKEESWPGSGLFDSLLMTDDVYIRNPKADIPF